MMRQKSSGSFWKDVLSPVTSICVAVMRIGISERSRQGREAKRSQDPYLYSDMQALTFTFMDSKDAIEDRAQIHGEGPSSILLTSSKKSMSARKHASRDEEEKNVSSFKQTEKIDKERVSQRKKVRELEKRILVPLITLEGTESCYLISNSENAKRIVRNNNDRPMPMKMTRRIYVQSLDSSDISRKAGTGLKGFDSSLSKKAKTLSKSPRSPAAHDKGGRINKKKTFQSPIEWTNLSSRHDSLGSSPQESVDMKPLYPFPDKELLPRKSSKGEFLNQSDANSDDLGGLNIIEKNMKIRIHVSLPDMKESIKTKAVSKNRKGKEGKALPKIKSSFSAEELQSIVYTGDRNDVHLLDYTSLTEGYKKTKRRSKIKFGHASQLLTTNDDGNCRYSPNEVLTRHSKKREGVGKRIEHRKQKDAKKVQSDLHIKGQDDEASGRTIKSIMKNGDSRNRNSSQDAMKMRRVSFCKKTIRTFASDREKGTKK